MRGERPQQERSRQKKGLKASFKEKTADDFSCLCFFTWPLGESKLSGFPRGLIFLGPSGSLAFKGTFQVSKVMSPASSDHPLHICPEDQSLHWPSIIPMVIIHIMPLGLFFVELNYPRDLIIAGVYYFFLTFCITAGFHRYFAHRSYKMGRIMQFLMAFGATMGAQKGPLWWVSIHRYHHKFSDQEEDIHTPKKGFWRSHIGWMWCNRYHNISYDLVKDWQKFPELRLLDRFYVVPVILSGATIYYFFGLSALLFGYFLVHVISYHVTFSVNSLTHIFGSRRFPTKDGSRNFIPIALLAFGEGWHNNHHHYSHSANQGFYWWEIDISYYTLKVLSWIGLVADLRKPPKEFLTRSIAEKS